MFLESSLNELYQSTVAAFPQTERRQYSTNPVVLKHLQWVPFLGMRTLFVKGLAESGGKEYGPIILFKNVQYHNVEGPRIVPLAASDGRNYFLEQLSADDTDVLVRCNCADFFWRWHNANHLHKALYGRNRKKYEALHNPGSANPNDDMGMCKHLLKMAKTLKESGVLRNLTKI